MSAALPIFLAGLVIIIILIGIGQYYRKKVYQEVDKLESWKISISNRPITDELSKVKNLNMTGETELLFEKWREQWDNIVGIEIPKIDEILFDAEEYINKYQIQKSRKEIEQGKKVLENAEKQIEEILVELKELIGSEEKNSQEIQNLKDLYRDTQKTLLAHHFAFDEAEPKLSALLNDVKKLFVSYEDATEQGNYLQAREVVLTIERDLHNLREMMETVPTLLIEAETSLLTQLEDMMSGYRDMKNQSFVLEHLMIEKEYGELKLKLEEVVESVVNLEIEYAKSGINNVKERMEQIYDQLEVEVLAKNYLQNELWNVHDLLQTVQEANKSTKEETLFVQQSYQIQEKDLESQRYIEKQLSIMHKRYNVIQLKYAEMNIAFSVLKHELEDIKEQIVDLQELQQHYIVTLSTLRKEELAAREYIEEMKKQLSDSKIMLKHSNLPGLPENYLKKLKKTTESISTVIFRLEDKPLNMIKVNETLSIAKEDVSVFINETNEIIEQAMLVEKMIQYGNRYRTSNVRVSNQLSVAEELFRDFNYSQALEEAAAAIEIAEPGGVKRLEMLLNES